MNVVSRVLGRTVERGVWVGLGGEGGRALARCRERLSATIARTSELFRPFPSPLPIPALGPAKEAAIRSTYTTPDALLAIPGFLAFILIPSSA